MTEVEQERADSLKLLMQAAYERGRADERADVVAEVRSEAQLCDCFAREAGECACGAWDREPGQRTYKRAYIEDIADAIARREHPKGTDK